MPKGAEVVADKRGGTEEDTGNTVDFKPTAKPARMTVAVPVLEDSACASRRRSRGGIDLGDDADEHATPNRETDPKRRIP